MAITVLIADDHAVVRDGLVALLAETGDIEVVGVAATGRDALREAERLQPDIALLDISMPDLDGIAAAGRLRAKSPRTQVIMLSMHVSREYIYLALQAGARGYLVKDSAGRDVIEAVRAVHAGKRYLSPQITDELVGDFLLDEGRSVGPLGSLSEREREILELVVEGRSSAQIGTTLHLSPKTIETYRSRLMQKLGVGDITGLVKFAVKHGLTSLE